MNEAPQKTALFNPFNGHLEQLFSYIDIINEIIAGVK